ncbi:sporulation protein [Actinomadura algeriensis]|uniref:Sporulation-control protein n=1 Tax=Actinomadura algeriensis TaxID=1679523 RepID=A0ABR9JVD7_9ACTN|nr:sporulation protein [Actinomadura algeriensis]MBE1534346.1 sporulation-control protein [Actinomadura algeriensis]
MAFRTLLSSLGVNAPRVETVLVSSAVRPGGTLAASVTLEGGGADVSVERLGVELVTRVEARETTETRWTNPGVVVSHGTGAFELGAGETREFRLDIEVPWEMPVTHALGRSLKGARAAVRTTVEIGKAVDRGDFDEVAVHALPAQDMCFEAFRRLGFRFDEAEVKRFRAHGGINQTLPYCQELEFWFPREYGRPRGDQLEVMFIARHDSMDLITGPRGPYPFTYSEMERERFVRWLDGHCRSAWGTGVSRGRSPDRGAGRSSG